MSSNKNNKHKEFEIKFIEAASSKNTNDTREKLRKFKGGQKSITANMSQYIRANQTLDNSFIDDDLDERAQFITRGGQHNSTSGSRTTTTTLVGSDNQQRSNTLNSSKKSLNRKAKLAREETMDYDYDPAALFSSTNGTKSPPGNCQSNKQTNCFNGSSFCNFIKRKRIFIPLILISCIAAIYCVPFIEIEPRIIRKLPNIPFNFNHGPLRSSGASQFKVDRLFQNQVQGPESIAIDSTGNMYLAIEGGFILYAHLNKSSPLKRSYYEIQAPQTTTTTTTTSQQSQQQQQLTIDQVVNQLIKIAELNGIKQVPYERQNKRRARDGVESGGAWRRECQLDEKIYGQHLYSPGFLLNNPQQQSSSSYLNSNEISDSQQDSQQGGKAKFKSNVHLSRCSKPLGIRLSPDESYLYVVDTLSGLYRVSLKVPERPYSTQRLVTKLVDFKPGKSQLLPVIQLDSPQTTTANIQPAISPATTTTTMPPNQDVNNNAIIPSIRARAYLNVTLKAVDDLAIDYGAGTRGGDMIYMSLASQSWQALSYMFDLLEGRPTGAILRYDSGLNQLSVLDPIRIAQVRTSINELENPTSRLYTTVNETSEEPYMGIGAPRLDENDVFDERPLHFPNGIELTDDRQALLIADTSNHRIIKHYIRGSRKGTSDLWAWTPNIPDNIRRGYDKGQETYWVAGCGQDMTDKFDPQALLNSWPRVRKFLLKNVYLFGWLIEMFGKHILHSTKIRDMGYSFKIGNTMCEQFCPGMMIIQYNKFGDILRSIHSKEFPNDLAYYSQVTEVFDSISQESILYLGSPSYSYVTKLILPTDTHPIDANLPSPSAMLAFNDI